MAEREYVQRGSWKALGCGWVVWLGGLLALLILAAVLRPAFAPGRYHGPSRCTLNLRALGEALVMYATDHAERLPVADRVANTDRIESVFLRKTIVVYEQVLQHKGRGIIPPHTCIGWKASTDKGSGTMERQIPYAEIKEVDDNTIEVFYFEKPGKLTQRPWRLSIQEATHIADWWRFEGQKLTTWHTPVMNRQVGEIMVSMFSPERVCVGTLDKYGSVKRTRRPLPSKVVRHLADWFSDK